MAALEAQLANVEKTTTAQVIVAVYPSLPEGADVAAYAQKVFNAWGIGQKDKNNGVLLIVFVGDHKLNITTGKGIEKILPDAACQKIIDHDIVPLFKMSDYDAGIAAGVQSIIKAIAAPAPATNPAPTTTPVAAAASAHS